MQLEFEIPLLVVLIGLSGFFSGLEVSFGRSSNIKRLNRW